MKAQDLITSMTVLLIISVVRGCCTETRYTFQKASLGVSGNVESSGSLTIRAFSKTECTFACVAMETCVAISYREEDQHCLLRDGQHLLSGPDTAQAPGTEHYKKSIEGDCSDYWTGGYRTSGPYRLTLPGGGAPFTAVCDFQTEGGPWITFQRRLDGSVDFYRNWSNYTTGFGSLRGEFWLGNDLLHQLTASGWTQLRVDLEDFEGERRYAAYSSFSVASASDKYRLRVSGYRGTAGDSLTHHDNLMFSTFDGDHDLNSGNCAVSHHGAWWYLSCHTSNLNGGYLRGVYQSFADGVCWKTWRGYAYSLKVTEMKLTKPSQPPLQ